MRTISKRDTRRLKHLGLVLALLILISTQVSGAAPSRRGCFGFAVRLTWKAAKEIRDLGLQVPITGRVYVIITKDDDGEPRDQIDVTGVPFWGKDVHLWTPIRTVRLNDGDPSMIGFPLEKLADIPAGDYYVQAFLNVYTEFHRADGHVVQMHLNAGEGQWLWESPGNAYSDPKLVHLDPAQGCTVYLRLTNVIPPIYPLEPGDVLQQGSPEDSDWVKFVKIKSDVVSDFWGHPMYIGANILLPKGYDENPDTFYPVIYMQGHFPGGRAAFGFREGNDFYDFWTSDEAPRFIAAAFRDANPFYDTSYSVNSANVGPYGDAIMTELIPYIEENFRIIQEPWARLLAGGSTGGWEALAMKVWNPDFFSGTWAWCPDSVDFRYHQLVNVYEDDNAYFTEYDWVKVERPSARRPDGNLLFTIKQENDWERAMAPDDRSGGQWDIWEAVYSPLGDDGYPEPVWDPITGVIDHSVAEYWMENYDIRYKLEQEWPEIGPKMVGHLTLTNGDMDTYYLNESSYLLRDFLESTTDPYADATFDFGYKQPHCWIGESPNNPGEEMSYIEFLQIAAEFVEAHAP